METIEEVRERLNQCLQGTRLGEFYRIRRELKGKGYDHGGLFQRSRGGSRGYAFHRGGRKELQFNIGFEDDHYFRYGVAFSLEAGQDLPDPIETLDSRIEAFNAIIPMQPRLARFYMWVHHQNGDVTEYPAGPIPTNVLANGNFIFLGQKESLAGRGVTAALLERAVDTLLDLLPLYEAIERHVHRQFQLHAQPSATTRRYAARISYNSRQWRAPAGANDASESGSSYRSAHGFGHEDWLFRDEWQLGGWRYGFVQGVNRSRKRLLKERDVFDLELFVISSHGRSLVCEIRDVEILEDGQAADAVKAYVTNGWFATMRREVQQAGGNAQALDPTKPHEILNIRFRAGNIRRIDADEVIPNWHPARNLHRYALYALKTEQEAGTSEWRGRAGVPDLPDPDERQRRTRANAIVYSPEHQKMQLALVKRLRQAHPTARISYEENFVDVTLKTEDAIVLYEVKSDLHPLRVIRQALGQLLEYAYHPRSTYAIEPSLVIVGRQPLRGQDLAFFQHICTQFGLPITYEVIEV